MTREELVALELVALRRVDHAAALAEVASDHLQKAQKRNAERAQELMGAVDALHAVRRELAALDAQKEAP
jgi:hypothetical protein